MLSKFRYGAVKIANNNVGRTKTRRTKKNSSRALGKE